MTGVLILTIPSVGRLRSELCAVFAKQIEEQSYLLCHVIIAVDPTTSHSCSFSLLEEESELVQHVCHGVGESAGKI